MKKRYLLGIAIIILISILFALNIIATSSDYCYQETANVSTACGGLSTGNYSSSGADMSLLVDGNWSTGISADGVDDYYYMNYSKLSGTTYGAIWQVKDNIDGSINTKNLTLNDNYCLANNPVQLRLFEDISFGPSCQYFWQCLNDTTWITLNSSAKSTDSSCIAYEEGMFLNITIPITIAHKATQYQCMVNGTCVEYLNVELPDNSEIGYNYLCNLINCSKIT